VSISVVIPAYRAPTLSAVLDALEPQARAAGCEVIVIESTGAEAAQRLREDRPWVRVLAPAERTLPGRARNLAAGVASGELLAFLDADAIPEAGWLGRRLRDPLASSSS
jgi:glycosyltransferase involved in cell wall biosynthesis